MAGLMRSFGLLFRRIVLVLLLLAATSYVLFVTSLLPRTRQARIVGGGFLRDGATGVECVPGPEALDSPSDSSCVRAIDRQGRRLVFLNSERRWGMPSAWFAVDSSMLSLRAEELARDPSLWASAGYYGFHIPGLGRFPTLVSLEQGIPGSERHVYLASIVTMHLGLAFWIRRAYRRRRRSQCASSGDDPQPC